MATGFRQNPCEASCPAILAKTIVEREAAAQHGEIADGGYRAETQARLHIDLSYIQTHIGKLIDTAYSKLRCPSRMLTSDTWEASPRCAERARATAQSLAPYLGYLTTEEAAAMAGIGLDPDLRPAAMPVCEPASYATIEASGQISALGSSSDAQAA
jgi:hypothetical protein